MRKRNGRKQSLSVGQAMELYLASLVAAGRSKGTARTYQHVLSHLGKRLGKTRDVQDVTAIELAQYISSLRDGDSLSQAYLSLCGRIIKRFFGWLTEAGQIEENPMMAIKLWVPAWDPVPPYSDDELRRLIDAAITPIQRAGIVLSAIRP